jgi:D-glycero-D-manno-heptose 1,7-bisphosphate phosphatase
MGEKLTAAIFLDRDGVIIENRASYVRSWSDVVFLPQALAALQRISKLNYRVVIVTNQSGIGRGLIAPATADDINERLVAEIQDAGGRIDAVYMCPHTPADHCRCRKPAPGMLQAATRDLGIDLSQSLLIGDALSDLKAGLRAGVGRVALVRSGRGAAQAALASAERLPLFPIYEDLAEALCGLIPFSQ